MLCLVFDEKENKYYQFEEDGIFREIIRRKNGFKLIIKLKTAENVEDINKERNKIEERIPIVRIMFDYDQKNQAHQYDLWMHSLHTVVNLPRNMEDDMLYLVALLHDHKEVLRLLEIL